MNDHSGIPNTEHLFGLDIWSASHADAVAELIHITERGGPCRIVVTPNTDHLVRLHKNPELFSDYCQADYFFPDGMPIVWASRLLGAPLAERVTGADLFTDLCRKSAQKNGRIFIIGGQPGQENFLKVALEERFPGLVVGVHSPPMGFQPAGDAADTALAQVNNFRPDILFICLGMPKQELWCLNNRKSIGAPLALCVGAALEFAVGAKRRAPVWVRKIGMEWAWRLAAEPHRLWKRYLVDDVQFARIILRERKLRKSTAEKLT